MENQKKIPFSPPDITEDEINEVTLALKSGWITTGPKTKELERKISEYIGVSKTVCLNSATAAMELSLHILGVGPGDEVITSAYTYSASASVIHHVGARIVLVDTAPGSFEMDYTKLEDAISERTKAIIPVDVAGVICDYDRIYAAIKKKTALFSPKNDRQASLGRIAVIADAAHSFGATRDAKPSGSFGDITCFSFHAVKNLTTAEGGAVVWKHSLGMTDDELYREYMLYSLHGQSKDALSKMQIGSWEYDIIYLAYKNNMTDILAALGIAQLNRYNQLLNRRFEIVDLYEKLLNKDKITIIKHRGDNFKSSAHLLLCNIAGCSLEQRNRIIMKLAEKGISTNVHYKPLPLFTAYKEYGFDIIDFSNAFNQYANEITLPLHTLLTNEDVEYVASMLNIAVNEECI